MIYEQSRQEVDEVGVRKFRQRVTSAGNHTGNADFFFRSCLGSLDSQLSVIKPLNTLSRIQLLQNTFWRFLQVALTEKVAHATSSVAGNVDAAGRK